MNLNEQINKNCIQCKGGKENRKTDEFGICSETKSVSDGKSVRCIGDWGKDKIYYLTQYFGIFATGMKNKFSGKLNYLEICSGPGRCICRETGEEIDGTPLAIINHDSFKDLSKAFFIDYSDEVVDTLNDRIKARGLSEKVKAYKGDYHDTSSLDIVLNQLPKNGLTLVLIDPTDCSLPFETVKYIANKLGRVDFLINVAIYTDLGRNAKNVALKGYDKNKYNNFLGDNFFDKEDIIELIKTGKDQEVRIKFREAYMNSLKSIGYQHFDLKTIGSYYDLLYTSKNAKGIEFWKKATKYSPNKQTEMNF